MNKKATYIGILSLALIVLIILIKTNLITTFDAAVYNLLTMYMNESLTSIAKAITLLGQDKFIIFVLILVLIISFILKKIKTGAIVVLFLIITHTLNYIIKIIFQRPRPEILRLIEENGFSFPSGHTMAATALYGILIYLILKSELNKNLKIISASILSLMAFSVGLSRIYLGVHYASDVLGAFLISIILLLILISINEKKEFF